MFVELQAWQLWQSFEPPGLPTHEHDDIPLADEVLASIKPAMLLASFAGLLETAPAKWVNVHELRLMHSIDPHELGNTYDR